MKPGIWRSLAATAAVTAITLLHPVFLSASGTYRFNAIDVQSGQSAERMLEENKWNLVAVWALDCITCEEQKPALSQFHRTYSQLNVVGLSIDGQAALTAIRNKLAQQPVPFTNYLVDQTDINRFFDTYLQAIFYGTPTYILYSPDGQVADVHAGPLDFTSLQTILKSYNTRTPAAKTPSADITR